MRSAPSQVGGEDRLSIERPPGGLPEGRGLCRSRHRVDQFVPVIALAEPGGHQDAGDVTRNDV